MNLSDYGTSKPFVWSHDYLVKLVSTGKSPILEEPLQINAFKSIKRGDFVPNRLGEMAYLDKDIDIGYGEKLTRPAVAAQMLALLRPKVGGKYLDIGSGSGYFAMLLAKSIGNSGEVYGLERIQWLWESSRAAQNRYPEIKNLKFLYRNGSEGLAEKAPYDGIHIGFDVDSAPDDSFIHKVREQLKVRHGVLVYPHGVDIKVVERTGLDDYMEEIVPGFHFQPMKLGLD